MSDGHNPGCKGGWMTLKNGDVLCTNNPYACVPLPDEVDGWVDFNELEWVEDGGRGTIGFIQTIPEYCKEGMRIGDMYWLGDHEGNKCLAQYVRSSGATRPTRRFAVTRVHMVGQPEPPECKVCKGGHETYYCCKVCDRGGHTCGGCGDDVEHGEYSCGGCYAS